MARRTGGLLLLLASVLLASGCATRPPERTDNLCEIFDHQPSWYDYARDSEERWGTPIAIQMAIINQESTFRARARPPRKRLLGFIPWRRPSSAYGYAQAQDPVWGEYLEAEGGLLSRRTHMKHALDFVGWYNHNTYRRLNIAKTDARNLYYAYHEGHTGYRRGSHHNKPGVQRAARRVSDHASRYQVQLEGCERRFRCRRFWQFGPFCDA